MLLNNRNDLQFACNQLSKTQHHDYKEYLELAIIFLGGTVHNFFKRPGAMHYARWMAKTLYCLKIWMFRKQINDLDQNDIKLITIVSIFALQAYLKPLFTACNAPSVPRTDLTLLGQLKNYHHSVGRVAAAKLEGHLWYLSPELVSLALFDDLDSPNTKQASVQARARRKEEGKAQAQKSQSKTVERNSSDPRYFTLTTPAFRNLLHQLHLDEFLEDEFLEALATK